MRMTLSARPWCATQQHTSTFFANKQNLCIYYAKRKYQRDLVADLLKYSLEVIRTFPTESMEGDFHSCEAEIVS